MKRKSEIKKMEEFQKQMVAEKKIEKEQIKEMEKEEKLDKWLTKQAENTLIGNEKKRKKEI